MTTSEILTRVKAAIDELEDVTSVNISETGEEDGTGATLDTLIIDKIPYALSWVLENAPASLLDDDCLTQYTGGSVTAGTTLRMEIDENLIATVELPDDMLRLVAARLSSWLYTPMPVSQFSEIAMMQMFDTSMGCPTKPVSVLLMDTGKKILKMFTADTENDTLSIAIIKKPDLSLTGDEATDSVTIPDKLLRSFIYYIAGLVLLSLRDGAAENMLLIARDGLKVEEDG